MVLIVAGDPNQYTGGYIYDARITAALTRAGHEIETIGLAGTFPVADETATNAMADTLDGLSDDAHIVIDGLALGTLGDTVAAHRRGRAVTALVHHPLADEAGLAPATAAALYHAEARALAGVDQIIVTSVFTARRLREDYVDDAKPITVVEPGTTGVRPAPVVRQPPPQRLLCIATLIPRKGHAILIEALARLRTLDWHCDWIGDTSRDPDHTARLRAAIDQAGLTDRITLHGALPPVELDTAYRTADLFVLPSYYEGYGMVITEAISHALPVITTTGGALADTLPEQAGVAVAPGDSEALATAIEQCLTEPAYYGALADGAAAAARSLGDWDTAGQRFAAALGLRQSTAST